MSSAALHDSGDAGRQKRHDWYRGPGRSSEVLGDRQRVGKERISLLGGNDSSQGLTNMLFTKCTKLLRPTTRREQCVKLTSLK